MPINLPDPSDIDAWIEIVEDPDKARVAIRNKSCPEQAMQKALQKFPELESQIVYNPAAPTHLLEEIYKRASWSGTRSTVVEHLNANDKILRIASQDSDNIVRKSVAQRVNSHVILEQLAKDSDLIVRIGVAENPHTTTEILKLLVNPIIPNLAAAVLKNKNCSLEIFKQVANSQIDEDWLPEPLLAFAPEEMINDIYNRSPKNKRYYVLKNPMVSESLLLDLFSEEIPDQSYFSLNNSLKYLFKREDLSEKLFVAALKRAPENCQLYFAGYRKLTQVMIEALISMKSVDLKLGLISNESVSGEQLLSLVKDKSKKVQAALREKTYFGQDSSGEYGKLPYENREILWTTLDFGVSQKPKKKLSQNSAIEEIFSSTFSKSEFEELTKYYLKSRSQSTFTVDNCHPWLAAATTIDQRDRLIACIRVRAAQLGFLEPESLRDEPYFYVMARVEGGTLKYVLEPFLKTFDDLNFRIIRALGRLESVINYSLDVRNLSKIHVLELLESADPYFNWKIATQYPLDVDLLVALADSPAYRQSTYSENINDKDLQFGQWTFYASNGYRIESHPAAIVAVHPLTPREILEKLRKSSNQYIRGLFIEDKRLFSMATLEGSIKDKSTHVRTLVASHPNSTPQMLEFLASDKDAQVRTAIKMNPNTPAEVKAMLALLKD